MCTKVAKDSPIPRKQGFSTECMTYSGTGVVFFSTRPTTVDAYLIATV